MTEESYLCFGLELWSADETRGHLSFVPENGKRGKWAHAIFSRVGCGCGAGSFGREVRVEDRRWFNSVFFTSAELERQIFLINIIMNKRLQLRAYMYLK